MLMGRYGCGVTGITSQRTKTRILRSVAGTGSAGLGVMVVARSNLPGWNVIRVLTLQTSKVGWTYEASPHSSLYFQRVLKRDESTISGMKKSSQRCPESSKVGQISKVVPAFRVSKAQGAHKDGRGAGGGLGGGMGGM